MRKENVRTRHSAPAAPAVGATMTRTSPLTLHSLYLGEYRDKSLASAGWQNPPPMETFAQNGSLSAPLASSEKDNTRR